MFIKNEKNLNFFLDNVDFNILDSKMKEDFLRNLFENHINKLIENPNNLGKK